jgi:hypothetical protein
MTGTQAYSRNYKPYEHNLATIRHLILSRCYAIISDDHNIIQKPSAQGEALQLKSKNGLTFNESSVLLMQRKEIASSLYEFKFGSLQNYRFSKFLPGVSWIGRHFSLSSTKLNKTRYYSLCLSLDPLYQEKLLLLCENVKKLECKENIEIERLQINQNQLATNDISFYIKVYVSKRALSNHLFHLKESNQTDLIIKGPLVFFFNLGTWSQFI